MSVEPGTRVFAVRNADETTVTMYGFGVYAGRFARPNAIKFSEEEIDEITEQIVAASSEPIDVAGVQAHYDRHVAEGKCTQETANDLVIKYVRDKEESRARDPRERALEIIDKMNSNPRVDLDNGSTVWGYQCWWAPEDGFEAFVAGRTIVEVPVESEIDD